MAPQRHRYTKCILLTGQRANKSNERVVCKYCSEAESPQWALQNALLCNTKKLVKSHLRRCRYFRAAQESGHDELVVFTEDEDENGYANKANKRKAFQLVGANTNTNFSGSGANAYFPTVGGNATNDNNNNNSKRPKGEDAMMTDGSLHRPSSGPSRGASPAASANYRHGASASTAAVNDQDTLDRLLLNATLANQWCFSWVDVRASIQLVHHLQPYVLLPTSDALAGRILEKAGEQETALLWHALEKEKLGCTLVLDSWGKKKVAHEQLGFALTTPQAQVIVWKTLEMEHNINDTEAALQQAISSEFQSLANSSVAVIAMAMDSNPSYTSVRRTLRRQRRDLMVLPCLVHQLNAFLSDMFHLVPVFQQTIHKVIEITAETCFVQDSTLHQKTPLERLNLQKAAELRRLLLAMSTGKMEWSGLHKLIAGVLDMKEDPLTVRCHQATSSTSDPLQDQDQNAQDERREAIVHDAVETPLAPSSSSSPFGSESLDASFWLHLGNLDRIFSCVGQWISLLQVHDHAPRLHHIPFITHSIATTLSQHIQLSPENRSPLVERLETRWNEWEHPLMVLVVVLNPAFGWKAIDTAGVTLTRLGCWARYYYESFFGGTTQANNLSKELLEYVEGDKFWCSPSVIGSFVTPPRQPTSTTQDVEDHNKLLARLSFKVIPFWKSCSADCPELAKLALRVFSVALTSASTDGLFDAGPPLDSISPFGGRDRQLAALRVRARAYYDQRRETAPVRTTVTAPASINGVSDPPTSSGGSKIKQAAMVYAQFEELVHRWDDQELHKMDDGVSRETTNENEAIHAMYATIHPADDEFSKYSIQTLFSKHE